MVAKITVPASIRRALNYNEQKIKEDKAECLYAHHFLKEAEQLGFYEKLQRFERLITLNKRATTNAVHVSLNFAAHEKLSGEKLIAIAVTYMEKIGFAQQPYLVYRHHDAGHPHIHIVTTNIQQDGKRISLHNIGRNQSEKARKEIEVEYKLVKAEKQISQEEIRVNAVPATKIKYGKTVTKQAISNVLKAVLPDYKYSSLAELNAVLKLYNIVADRGAESGTIFRKRGLVYRVLDEKGNKTGVPIKASSIYFKPTLSYIEKKIEENSPLKDQHKKNVRTSVDWVLRKSPDSLLSFKKMLEKEKISLNIRQNDKGFVYGLTYIDHSSKTVFNGSDIGKEYSAKAILERCGITQAGEELPQKRKEQESHMESASIEPQSRQQPEPELNKLLDIVITPQEGFNYVPFEWRKRKRKRKKM